MNDAEPSSRGPAAGSGITTATSKGRSRSILLSSLYCLRVSLLSGSMVLMGALLVAILGYLASLVVFRSVDPPGSMLMLAQKMEGRAVTQSWVPLDRISNNLVRAVIVSEDGQFCRHIGVDFRELAAALEKAERGEDVRGASTISMQVAKNMFLWPDRSYVRKALEIGLTLVMEQVWSKPRILEIYLNIAEWGPGIFGAEAAARHHFGKSASRLTEREAALLAAALPSPVERRAGRPSAQHQRIAAVVERRMRTLTGRDACIPRPVALR